MITINLDPTLLTLGPLSIRVFGITTALAVVGGVVLAGWLARRRGIAGAEVDTAAIWVIIAGALGARLVYVLERLDDFRRVPRAALAFQEGGLSGYGALIAGALALLVYARLRRLPTGQLFDAAAPAVLVGLAIGRIGNLLTGSVQGTPTLLPWGVAYTHRESLAPMLGVYGHPVAAYEILWNLLLVGLLAGPGRRLRPAGTGFLVGAALYSAGRLAIDAFRLAPARWLGLQSAQLLAAAVLVVTIVLLIRQRVIATAPTERVPASATPAPEPEAAGER